MRTVLILFMVVGCGGKPPPVVASTPVATERADEDAHAAAPYTASQIRESNPAGTVYRYSYREPERETVRVIEFLTADDSGAEVRTSSLGLDGEPTADPIQHRSTWEEFASHAHYPAAATRISDSEIETPAGKFVTKLYVVTGERKGAVVVTHAHFDVAHAGPPVHIVMTEGGEQYMEMVLIERRVGPG